MERGLPANPDAERWALGAVILEGSRFDEVRAALQAEDFSLEKHRRIFNAMSGIRDAGEEVNRITVAKELMRRGELEAVDGLTYLTSLDAGMPSGMSIGSYLSIIREDSALRKTIFASQGLINRCLAGERTKDLATPAEEILLALGTDQQDGGPQTAEQIIETFPGGINSFLSPHLRRDGLETGFIKLDSMTGGFHPQEFIILAARPGVGKSAMALNMAQHIALNKGKTVMIFSLEMSKAALLTRLVCGMARVDLQRFRLGYIGPEERARLQKASAALADAPLYIDDKSAATMADLHARIRRRMATDPVHLVIVDYLQLMSGGKQYESRNQEVTAISRGMKLLAAEINAPVVALSQLSRAPELRKGGARPQLSDLRDSGSLEQDCDICLFIYREEMHKADRDDLRGKAELIIGKSRNGPTGKIDLVFLHNLTRFENRASDIAPEMPLLDNQGED